MNTAAKNSRIAIVGTEIVTTEAEARDAARKYLDWFGSSEEERGPLEVEVNPEWDRENDCETGRFEVRECYGSETSLDCYDLNVIGVYDTEAEAEAVADKHNEEALAQVMDADWIEVPAKIDSVWLNVERGNYPQSRRAEVTITIDGVDVVGTGHGSVRFVRDVFCIGAVQSALEEAVECITAAQDGYYAGRRENFRLGTMSRADVVTLCRAVKTAE
jgi:hypothetical protein